MAKSKAGEIGSMKKLVVLIAKILGRNTKTGRIEIENALSVLSELIYEDELTPKSIQHLKLIEFLYLFGADRLKNRAAENH